MDIISGSEGAQRLRSHLDPDQRSCSCTSYRRLSKRIEAVFCLTYTRIADKSGCNKADNSIWAPALFRPATQPHIPPTQSKVESACSLTLKPKERLNFDKYEWQMRNNTGNRESLLLCNFYEKPRKFVCVKWVGMFLCQVSCQVLNQSRILRHLDQSDSGITDCIVPGSSCLPKISR